MDKIIEEESEKLSEAYEEYFDFLSLNDNFQVNKIIIIATNERTDFRRDGETG
jgi:hypothetical protein